MSVVINGSGTITGISVGGLENGCVSADDLATAAVTETKLASNAVTLDKLDSTLQSQVCKAWVNFNGTGTVAIRASYNVSSITDNGTGDYTVNFTTALADANYSAHLSSGNTVTGGYYSPAIFVNDNALTPTTSAIRISMVQSSNVVAWDPARVYVAIFR